MVKSKFYKRGKFDRIIRTGYYSKEKDVPSDWGDILLKIMQAEVSGATGQCAPEAWYLVRATGLWWLAQTQSAYQPVSETFWHEMQLCTSCCETTYGDVRGQWGQSHNHIIAIGNHLKLSPGFPPLHTVHASFPAHGVPSFRLITLLHHRLELNFTSGGILTSSLFFTGSSPTFRNVGASFWLTQHPM